MQESATTFSPHCRATIASATVLCITFLSLIVGELGLALAHEAHFGREKRSLSRLDVHHTDIDGASRRREPRRRTELVHLTLREGLHGPEELLAQVFADTRMRIPAPTLAL